MNIPKFLKTLRKETSPSVQRSLRKLISEEWFAGQMYKLFILGVQDEDRKIIDGVLAEIAEDELDDHMANLIKVAREYGYEVPATLKEFEKYAGEADVKAFNTFKNKKDGETYLKLAFESELRAIQSYAEALKNNDLKDFYNVEAVMTNNYYDEVDHFNKIAFIIKAFDYDSQVIDQGIE